MKESNRIVHIVPTISRFAGGPSLSVRRLVESLNHLDPVTKWDVFSGDRCGSENDIRDWKIVIPNMFYNLGPKHFGWSPTLRSKLLEARPQVLHLHGLWKYHAWAAASVAKRLGIPLIISPRGMLEPWALGQGRPQKWVAAILFQRKMLERASCVVATSRLEGEGVRLAGVTSTVAIIPNGVDLVSESFRAFGGMRNVTGIRRTALFISRVHPKKGILDLLSAWRSVAPKDWRLRIVGPSEGGYAKVVSDFIQSYGLQTSVSLEGALWGKEKMQALAQAELFILPSYSENFGLAVAEALAAGVPVVTTKATPWQELMTEHCGWWTDVGVAALTAALGVALKTPTDDLAAMGRRGRTLMQRRYSWEAVATDMSELYRWVLGETASIPERLMFTRT